MPRHCPCHHHHHKIQGGHLGDWAVAGSDGEGQLMATDLLVFIRLLISFQRQILDFGCANQKIDDVQLLDMYHNSVHIEAFLVGRYIRHAEK
jgi:hypothetical protein